MSTSRAAHNNEDEEFVALLTPEEREMLDGYVAMAADQEREAEAQEWSEGLIGDAFPER